MYLKGFFVVKGKGLKEKGKGGNQPYRPGRAGTMQKKERGLSSSRSKNAGFCGMTERERGFASSLLQRGEERGCSRGRARVNGDLLLTAREKRERMSSGHSKKKKKEGG